MSNSDKSWQPHNPEGLAKMFSRLGWLGLWVQLVLLIVPIFLLIYVLFFSSPQSVQQKGLDLSNYLSYGSLLVMVFTAFWFFRYARLGPRIADASARPTQAAVVRTLWIGLWAACIGVVFSLLLILSAVGRFVMVLLATPQTGLQIAAAGADPGMTLSAIDAISLASLVMILAAELVVLGISLWLLFRVTRVATEPT